MGNNRNKKKKRRNWRIETAKNMNKILKMQIPTEAMVASSSKNANEPDFTTLQTVELYLSNNMRIVSFTRYIIENSKPFSLKDTEVVIDGQNFFYRLYGESDLSFEFGCESDQYAKYLKKYLSMFKRANVRLYIFFKGGHESISTKFDKLARDTNGKNFIIGGENTDIVHLVFMKTTYKQVLDEMNFDYVICEFESKRDCIAFAQKRKCPIISRDAEFCFTDLPYISHNNIVYNKERNVVECAVFKLNEFMRKYHVDKKKLAIFVVLTDQKIYPENYFIDFLKRCKIRPNNNYLRIEGILNYLSKTETDNAIRNIIERTRGLDRNEFLNNIRKVEQWICERVETGIPGQYIENGNEISFDNKDPRWFEKGVAAKHISLIYVNLYRSKVLLGSWAIADDNAQDAMLFSIEIIQYVYDLLTNFDGTHYEFIDFSIKKHSISPHSYSIKKPEYEAGSSVFENGWGEIRSLRLFEHFIEETLPKFDFEILNTVPEDARLLFIALVYFGHKKTDDVTKEVCSVLLSYVTLAVIKAHGQNQVTPDDCDAAARIIDEYSKTTKCEVIEILDRKLLHPLVEFQHCLEHLNSLNTLCGSPYKPTIYSKTYNGTLVYKVLYTIEQGHSGDGEVFLETILNPAPSVLMYVKDLLRMYKDIFNQL